MTNYVQITSFSPKDSLLTGEPNKKILGSQLDAEFSALATAVASKLETVSQSSVTAHQAALSIAETQIPDGSILARVGSNETVTGTWTFSTFPTFTGRTVWTNLNDGAGSGLDADTLDGANSTYYETATNLLYGTLPAGRMPALTGDVTTSTGAVATTINGKFLRHGGAYTSGTVTVSASAPSGGNNGDIWLVV
jgi:hypothetical protein